MSKMFSRKMQIWDLNEIRKLLAKNLQMPSLRVASCLIHFIFNIPLRLLGLSTIFGSVAQVDAQNIGGLIIARRFPLAKNWVIGPIVVDKSYRGSGIGTNILQFTLKVLVEKKASGALVCIDNSAHHLVARELLRKFGFKVLVKVFSTPKQAYQYSRMISRGQPIPKMKQEPFPMTTNLKNPKKTYYIFFKKIS